jgi:hypothetical protein
MKSGLRTRLLFQPNWEYRVVHRVQQVGDELLVVAAAEAVGLRATRGMMRAGIIAVGN